MAITPLVVYEVTMLEVGSPRASPPSTQGEEALALRSLVPSLRASGNHTVIHRPHNVQRHHSSPASGETLLHHFLVSSSGGFR